MKTNAIEGSAPLGQTQSTRDRFIGDFNASFETARSKLNESAQVGQTPQEELAEWLKKTPEQHMRDAILQSMGLTEEDLAAMEPEKRAAIEDAIAERIKEKMAEAAGNTPKQQQEQLLAMLSASLIDSKSIASDSKVIKTPEEKKTLI